MKDAAKRASAAVPGRGYETAAGLLALEPDPIAKTVYVMHDGTSVGFAREEQGVYYTEGMSWTFSRDDEHGYGLFVNFVFLGDVRQVVTETFLVSEPTANTQFCSIPPVEQEYSFLLLVGEDRRRHQNLQLIDPKIVVTPM